MERQTRELISFGFTALILFIYVIAIGSVTRPQSNIISIGGYSYRVLLATNLQQWQRGLMNYTFSCSVAGGCTNGMLFIFPSQETECFWMKDTSAPLAQVWIANGTVTKVYNATPESTANICAYGNEVLELSSGLPQNISVGSRVRVGR